MTRWPRFLVHPAAGVVCLATLLPLSSCGPERAAPPVVPAQVAPQDPVPVHARETLAYIRQHGFVPPGYMGGRVYGNYEGQLPRYNPRRKRIEYREWDVHPRAEGRRRGTERLITGKDGRAWYSPDRFRTFIEVK